ncbi:MAG TPA: aminotransferase class V-fold PLP-dependent enzyme [Candidatus Polarisedimenticolia bacterium]|nr:aminotransferase class V-fold PLP-dependent enzyme [Candidatus Polarisedimenticolia bacterium]
MIYLDNAATSHPKPESVYARMDRFAREVGANPGRAGHSMAVEAEREIAAVRGALASLFGAGDPSRIILALNATDALNMAFKGVLQQGDHVVTTQLEHNSVARPLARMERDGWIRVTRVAPGPGGLIDPDDVTRAMVDATRLVAVGQVSNVLGVAQPIGDIGRAVRLKDRLLLVDAAQGAGVVPIDVEADCVDLLAFTGHKGLLGPVGTGGLWVGGRARIRPWREGGTGGDSASPVQPEGFPHCLEAGTPNTVGIAGLGEALRWLAGRGIAALREHELAMAARFWDRLAADGRAVLYGRRPAPGASRTGIVSFNLRGLAASEVGAILDASFSIGVRAGLHCAPGAHRFLGTFPEGTVRISPGPFTTGQEIDSLAGALAEIAGSSAPAPV